MGCGSRFPSSIFRFWSVETGPLCGLRSVFSRLARSCWASRTAGASPRRPGADGRTGNPWLSCPDSGCYGRRSSWTRCRTSHLRCSSRLPPEVMTEICYFVLIVFITTDQSPTMYWRDGPYKSITNTYSSIN